ncbi:hypothetical protein G9F72_016925 [Clostridium estertheticum]|uniref:hypothetical protein n=1 Tax=Clostridium estertheticum TaxID=238834 RepID=UPI0013E91698|nr:hypothetical protein [Clostridium estertheticum]MBZ9688017.1 hypothetical protein [Clostridium estertheticum]
MAKKTFIPNWYEDRKTGVWNKKVKLYIKISLVVNIILMSLILNISNEKNNIEKYIGGENETINVIENIKKDTSIIEKYSELTKFFEDNNFSYENINITKDNLEIDIEVNDYEEYIHVIRRMEEHYSIKKLTPNIKNEGKFNFKVTL